MSQPSADSSLSFCPPFHAVKLFSLYTRFFFFSSPSSFCCTLSCVVAVVFVCVNACACASSPLGAPISRHVSSVILISSPRVAGELFTHQYFLSLSPNYSCTDSACCIVWMCHIDDADLYLYSHILSLSLSLFPASPFRLKTKTYQKRI